MAQVIPDPVVKNLFEQDRPSLLETLAEIPVRQFLNVELTTVEKRVADLVALLEDGSILHIDFQSTNDKDMAYRMAVYGAMIAQKYRPTQIRQVVLYMGQARLKMEDHLNLGGLTVSYRVIDIREVLTAEDLLRSDNPGDWALALLARGGVKRLRQIVEKANGLAGARRSRVLTQLAVFSGLRGASEQLRMEMKHMGVVIDIEKNVILRDIRDSAMAEGEARGKAEGMMLILRDVLESKFGALPKWAAQRLDKAAPAQVERWARKVLTASTLEGVLGRK